MNAEKEKAQTLIIKTQNSQSVRSDRDFSFSKFRASCVVKYNVVLSKKGTSFLQKDVRGFFPNKVVIQRSCRHPDMSGCKEDYLGVINAEKEASEVTYTYQSLILDD